MTFALIALLAVVAFVATSVITALADALGTPTGAAPRAPRRDELER